MRTCAECGADLTAKNAVRRTYTNKDGLGDKSVDGNYDARDDFDTNNSCDLSDGRYGLIDGSDTCNNCGEVVG